MKPFASDLTLARTIVVLCAAGSMLMGCRDISTSSAASTSPSGPITVVIGGGGSSSTTTSISAGLYIAVQTQWEQTSDWTDVGNCQIPLGSPATTVGGCTVHLPEARLFFSNTRFLVGSSDATMCKIVYFNPYYYLGSTSNSFLPPWDPSVTSPVDCTASPTPAACFNGSALSIVSDFPKHVGRYFLTAFGSEAHFDVPSANSKGQPDNKWMSNAKTDKTAAIPGQYVANTMQDYVVSCTDEWGEQQYSLRLKLADEDSASGEDPNGPLDNFSDWDGY